ncbi:methyl-accepting chemotaxis sensory transducer [Desulfarculus baarsii DSM 2075]|uniref:Methyl-accepting chemotaxis sensory transducer n=1 Tax=Desulfarculus baarsii (strain ATCC 33931 / DSM 2075 / LMG 7858 / VKM B-1802 / 2st14) TaxID=644282 RepID=E1QGI5_DESB2|nr:methyl-accepting chemotaxis protein [Desulfarculus baarsii]ADK84678.1 methyl-accepting chemotaxis sensory transducer [Desulfarculus baarsii DSM 2075]
MKRIGLKTKLGALLALAAATAIVIAIIGMNGMSDIDQRLERLVNVSAERVKLAARMGQNLLAIQRDEKNAILAETDEAMDAYDRSTAENVKTLQTRRETLLKLSGERGRAKLEQFDKAFEQYMATNKQVRELARLNSNYRARDLSADQGQQAFAAAEKAAEAILAHYAQKMNLLSQSQDLTEVAQLGAAVEMAVTTGRLMRRMLDIHRTEKNLILATTVEAMDTCARQIDERAKQAGEDVGILARDADPSAQASLNAFKDAWGKFMATNAQVIATARENGNNRAFALSAGEGYKLADQSRSVLTEIVEGNEAEMQADKEAADQDYQRQSTLMITVSLLGVILSLILGVMVARSVTNSLTKIFKGLKSFSTAELDETATVFRRIVAGLSEGADQVTSASGQVSTASQSLASGAAEQSASVEETSASMEEMASMTRKNADSASQADGLAQKANVSMSSLIDSMSEMNRASEETAKIVKTIDEVAFQTNLLALNAAVEAARAGEAGAGFAVVAEEVRNLAMRAAEAAKNTTGLIDDIVRRIKDGAELVGATNQDFTGVAQIIAEIAGSSREQAQGIDQVNAAMVEIDKVVQQSAANAEESAAAAEELNAQSEQMRGFVSEMLQLLDGDSGGASVARRPAARLAASAPAKPGATMKALPYKAGQQRAAAKPTTGPGVIAKKDPAKVIPLDDEADFADF